MNKNPQKPKITIVHQSLADGTGVGGVMAESNSRNAQTNTIRVLYLDPMVPYPPDDVLESDHSILMVKLFFRRCMVCLIPSLNAAMDRNVRGHKITIKQKLRNKRITHKRAPYERLFSLIIGRLRGILQEAQV